MAVPSGRMFSLGSYNRKEKTTVSQVAQLPRYEDLNPRKLLK